MLSGLARLAVGLRLCIGTAAYGQCDEWLPGLGDPGLPATALHTCAWDPDEGGPLPERMAVAMAIPSIFPSTPQPRRVMAWSGSEWEQIGPDFGGDILSLVALNGELVALGEFTWIGSGDVRYAARWDGTAWRQIGSDPPRNCRAGVVIDRVLHAASDRGVQAWEGGWQEVGPDLSGISTLGLYNGKLVAGGQFTVPGTTDSRNVAMLDGGVWRSIGGGVDGEVAALVEFEGSLITAARNVSRWDGAAWSAMAGLGALSVRALVVHEAQLIAGGTILPDGTPARQGVARWDGSHWQPMGNGLLVGGVLDRAGVFGLAVIDGQLAAAGGFLRTAVEESYFLSNAAMWDGTEWKAVAQGYLPARLFEYDGAVIAEGAVGAYLGFSSYGLARWNGETWSEFAPLPDASLLPSGVFAEDEGSLLMAAISTESSLWHCAMRWDGAAWSTVGGRAHGWIYAMAVHNGLVVAAGSFDRIDSVDAPGIAAWDGAAWSPLATQVSGSIDVLASVGGKLIAGGAFTSIGGVSASSIAQWDEEGWSPMGAGSTGNVTAMTEFNGELVAAGRFPNRIAKWTGSTWSPLGVSPNGRVLDFAVHNGELIAIGEFTTAGGAPAGRIAVWNGTSWRTLGSGLSGGVAKSVAVFGDQILVTGDFTRAGGELSTNFAVWEGCPSCPADLDGDGVVDFVDYLAFLTLFDELDPKADLNGDGIVDFPDYLAFLTMFDEGC